MLELSTRILLFEKFPLKVKIKNNISNEYVWWFFADEYKHQTFEVRSCNERSELIGFVNYLENHCISNIYIVINFTHLDGRGGEAVILKNDCKL